jgi:hypothetical protein
MSRLEIGYQSFIIIVGYPQLSNHSCAAMHHKGCVYTVLSCSVSKMLFYEFLWKVLARIEKGSKCSNEV